MPTDKIRINKFIASCGVCSRRAAEELILNGEIKVNSEVIKDLSFKVNPSTDLVTYKNKPISLVQETSLYAFYKPRAVVSTFNDTFRKRLCLKDFTKDLGVRVFSVGRLDYDVSGLMLLTNDGDYCHQLLHPKFEISRSYVALVKHKPTPRHFNLLTQGVVLDDGFGKASKACSPLLADELLFDLFGQDVNKNMLIYLKVEEGRKHFVKRILREVGLDVVLLSRVEYGRFDLYSLFKKGLRQGQIWKIKK